MQQIIHERMSRDTTEYWLQRLSEYDVPNAPILSIGEALEQPHVAARGLLETAHHPTEGDLRLVRGPIRFDGEGPAPASAPSLLGADTQSVLMHALGYDETKIERLRAEGAILSDA